MKTTLHTLTCICGATARNTTKERGRFNRRHPVTALEGTEAAAEHIAEQARLKGLAIQREQIKAEKAKDATGKAAQVAFVAAVYAAITKGAK